MIAISLWQPWASALFAPRPDGQPVKRYETRGWEMPRKFIGQRIAIHAAKHHTRDDRDFWTQTFWADSIHRAYYRRPFASFDELPRGAIIGEVIFEASVAVEKLSLDAIERHWGNYSPGRWAWPTTARTLYPQPIPCTGRQGFFIWERP